MNILVTGAAGFLGRWFAEAHLAAGDEVSGVDDLSNPHSYWPAGLDDRYQIDLVEFLNSIDLGEPQFDRIYHFAAPVGGRIKIETDPLFNADSLRLDSVMFRAAIHITPLLVYPSSSAVYGVGLQGPRATSLHEGAFSAANPNWMAPDEMYGFTKLVGERLAYTASRYGLNTLCIRPFSGYGEGQSPEYPVPAIALRARNHEDPLTVWGPGSQRRDFIHVEDIVKATFARLDHPVEGYETLNLGSGFPVSFNDIAQICAQIVGYDPVIENDTSKPVGVMTRFADIGRMRRYYQSQIRLREGLERVLAVL